MSAKRPLAGAGVRAMASFTVPAGARRTIEVRFGAAAARRLRRVVDRRGKVRLALSASVRDGRVDAQARIVLRG